jgi:D-alanyl-D-alanine dipeptidase
MVTKSYSRRIPKYKDLAAIVSGENGNKLIDLNSFCPEIICRYNKKDMLPFVGNKIFVRQALAARLLLVNKKLGQLIPGYRLKVVYGYRNYIVQQKYFLTKKKEIAPIFNLVNENKIIARTHSLVAEPNVAGHPVGGAVDLTIVDRNKKELDMGTGIADYKDVKKIKTFAQSITKTQLKNRKLLLDLMLAQGFAPFLGEWWHFSYGDKEWAYFYGRKKSLYSMIDFRIK